MKATISTTETGGINVQINGETFPARYINHTRGPAMMVTMPSRTVLGFYEFKHQKDIPMMKTLQIDIVAKALTEAGFEVEQP